MKKFLRNGLASMVLALALLLGVPALTQAQRPDETRQNRGAVHAQEAQARGQQNQDAAQRGQERGAQAKQEVKTRVEQIRADVKERRAEIKQRVCERRQEALQVAISNRTSGAENMKSSFDTVYERVQGFYAEGQLTVEDYEALTARVDAAQAEAETAVAAVKTFNFELDCENPNVADQIASFREAVFQTREALLTYREELVTLISSMRAEAAEQQGENSGENRNNAVRSERRGDDE